MFVCLVAVAVRNRGNVAEPVGKRSLPVDQTQRRAENLVNQSLVSAHTPNDYVKRANSYYPVLYKFNREIAEAREAHDIARVEELTHHLETLLDKGLAPTLVKARVQVENGTGVEEFRQAKKDLLDQVHALLAMLADNPAMKVSLEATKRKLDDVNIPAK